MVAHFHLAGVVVAQERSKTNQREFCGTNAGEAGGRCTIRYQKELVAKGMFFFTWPAISVQGSLVSRVILAMLVMVEVDAS